MNMSFNTNIPKNDNGDVMCLELDQKIIDKMDKCIAEGLFEDRNQMITTALFDIILRRKFFKSVSKSGV
ncbi:MAG: hypothetical protein MPEBLZ_01802 [Candidatus Methanoperedens nitroreducens]|uniref:Uncharacterized protein n=1 Tax=Candidatus Methanoperedens nitratireducens TaxID=1392998 RepID=A0A0P8AGT7_9EURY|nr:MAG: hypothetical protein MPEBLZ_01802 [Candidatus Methanoperedens sp. BLZ1]